VIVDIDNTVLTPAVLALCWSYQRLLVLGHLFGLGA